MRLWWLEILKSSRRPVVGMDLKLRNDPTVVGDNANMPFRLLSFDVGLRPASCTNQGKDKLKDFTSRFGLEFDDEENGYSFSHTFPPFLKEVRHPKARRYSFLKITDADHRYQWAHGISSSG
jgi:hypothetical protein